MKLLNIKYCILNNENDFINLKKLINFSKKNNTSVACLLKKNIIVSKNKSSSTSSIKSEIIRENFIRILLENVNSKTNLISTAGYASRELYQVRQK